MEYGSSKKCYSQIFLLFLPVIIDYSPKQNIKNNSMDKDLKKVVVLLNCTPTWKTHKPIKPCLMP